MHIKIKRTPGAIPGDASESVDEHERVDATPLLKELALHDSEEIDDDIMFVLHRYLASGRAPKGSMGLSRLDGFMTAVMASRDGVGVTRWMPAVWAGGEPEFEGMAEAEMVFAAMARRCRQITMQLHCTGELLCVLERGSQGEVFAAAWCRGFLQGVMLTPEQWASAFEHELGRSRGSERAGGRKNVYLYFIKDSSSNLSPVFLILSAHEPSVRVP